MLSMVIVPELALSSPDINLSTVAFPQPEGPTSRR